MKTLNKFFAGMLVATAAFGFFGCSDEPEEDENLVVSITGNQNMVTIAAPDEYDGVEVKLIYTTDGSEPSVALNSDKTDVTVTGNVYSDPFEITSNVTVKARGYYFDSTTTAFYQGPVATESVTYSDSTTADTSTASGSANGTFDFVMASSGNSNTTHYFDTSSTNVFALDSTNTHVYYQTQFSWKGSGKGNWYLYMRDINNGLIKDSSNNTTFVAKGTYTGNCFDSTSVTPSEGTLTLTTSDDSYEGTAAVALNSDSKYHFTLKVNNSTSAATGVTVGDAK